MQIDAIQDMILAMFYTRDVAPSVTEIMGEVGLSRAAVFKRMRRLVDDGMLRPPPQAGMARAYSLTHKGLERVRKLFAASMLRQPG